MYVIMIFASNLFNTLFTLLYNATKQSPQLLHNTCHDYNMAGIIRRVNCHDSLR